MGDSDLKLSPRQIELNRRYAWYCTQQYEARHVEWDGTKRLSAKEREQFAHTASTPAGWADFGRSIPLRFRRPVVGYHLVRIIVNRFTSLLFSENRHPMITVAGDKATDDYVKALIETSRFWARWREARNHGGAMGTAIVGFKFVAGVPRLEVFDPRWARPTFIDREAFELGALDIRYPFDAEKRDENGRWVVEKQWHRRYIDDRIDVVFKPLPVTEEEPANWPVQDAVDHKLGFCPAVWVQNHPVGDDIDGEPDVPAAALDNNEALDGLMSQSHVGTIKNLDPTLVLSTDDQLAGIKKGSDNAIKTEKGGNASYLEMQGSGPKFGMELAMQIKDIVLETSACVLESPDDVAKTATEIMRRYAAMTAQASTMREQYADFGFKPLLRKMATASRVLTRGRPTLVQVPHTANNPEASQGGAGEGATTAPDDDPKTQVVEGKIFLPPRVEVLPDGTEVLHERQIGPGPIDVIRCNWPQFFEPTSTEAQAAVAAVTGAFTAKLLDRTTAARYLAPFFDVEDVDAMLRKLDEEGASDQAMMGAAMGQVPGAPPPGMPGAPSEDIPPSIGEPTPGAPPPGVPPGAPPAATPPAGWGVLGKKA